MECSLSLLFGLILLVLIFFKKVEEFKGGRGFRMGGGGGNRTFDIIDVVGIVLVIYYLFLNK